LLAIEWARALHKSAREVPAFARGFHYEKLQGGECPIASSHVMLKVITAQLPRAAWPIAS